MKKVISLCISVVFIFVSVFGFSINLTWAKESNGSSNSNANSKSFKGYQEATEEQSLPYLEENMKKVQEKDQLRNEIDNSRKNVKEKLDELKQERIKNVQDINKEFKEKQNELQIQRKKEFEDNKNLYNEKIKEINNQRKEIRNSQKDKSVFNDVYKNKFKEMREEINNEFKNKKQEIGQKFREQVRTFQNDRVSSVKNQVYKTKDTRKELLEIHKEKINDIRNQIQQLKEEQTELRKELMRKIVSEKKAQQDNSTTVFVNGTDLEFDVPPVIKFGRTLVPVRAISKALGCDVDWNPESKQVSVVKSVYKKTYAPDTGKTDLTPDIITIILKIDSNEVFVNGEKQEIDVPASLVQGRTMVPFRFIAQALRKNVDWDKESGAVIIDDKND